MLFLLPPVAPHIITVNSSFENRHWPAPGARGISGGRECGRREPEGPGLAAPGQEGASRGQGGPRHPTSSAAFVWAGIPEPLGRRAAGLLAPRPATAHSASSASLPCPAPRLRPSAPPADRAPSPHALPRRLPHLHARGPGVNPRVQDGDEHPPPVILRVATEEGGGPGLFLGQQAVEGEGLLGGGGGHGRKLEDRGQGKLPGCARKTGARTPGRPRA